MPEEEWSEEVVDGINKALRSAHSIAEETYGSNQHSEITSIDINIGSPWKSISNPSVNRLGADPGVNVYNSQSVKYMKHYSGVVEFQGRLSGPVIVYPGTWLASSMTLMTLPVEYRPAWPVAFSLFGTIGGLNAAHAYAATDSTGVVTILSANPFGVLAANSLPDTALISFSFMAADSRPIPAPGFPISFRVACQDPPVGVIPIACIEENQKVVRPGPMLASADWKFSKKNDSGVVTIKNLAFSGFNNRIKVWFLVIYK